jgi:hypothetical protein
MIFIIILVLLRNNLDFKLLMNQTKYVVLNQLNQIIQYKMMIKMKKINKNI